MSGKGRALFTLALGLAAGACAGPPWFMGAPLNGRVSIPPSSAHLSFGELRAAAATAQSHGQTVLELRALCALDDLQRLTPGNEARLVALLPRRAADFHVLGRAIPESRDLERLARLSPARGAGFLGERAAAVRSAGDTWLALGAVDDARAAYARAIDLGAPDMDFRVLALWGHPPPASASRADLRAAIEALPLRAVPPLAEAYVERGGSDGPTLEKGLAAARQEHREALALRLAETLHTLTATHRDTHEDAGVSDGASPPEDAAPDASSPPDVADAPLALPAPPPMNLPADLEPWLLAGPTLSARLLPLAKARPEVLDDVTRAVQLVDLMLAEDDSSPDTLELAAVVFGRARRFGGTERMLMELEYATPDRADGLSRGAGVWDRLGRRREACVQWIRAARWRDDPEDPTWRTAIACARAEPGVADWHELRAYVLGRTSPERRAALAASLDR